MSAVVDVRCTSVSVLSLPEQKTFNSKPFPLVVTPDASNLDHDFHWWSEWTTNNSVLLRNNLLKYGAILFRGFPIDDPEQFDQFVKAFGYENFPYVGGAAVRGVVVGNVVTSNEAPSTSVIPFHHELAQIPDPPKVIFFFCDEAPGAGGETPISLSPVVYQQMVVKDPEFVRRLETEGVRYIRIAPDGDDPNSSIGRGWQSTFQTTDRTVAEARARDLDIEYEWLPDGGLMTVSKTLKAVGFDARTGETTWFNTITGAYEPLKTNRKDTTKTVMFPNGDKMPERGMQIMIDTLDEVSVAIPWKRTDVLMIDNRRVLHSRRPFTPPRRVLACLCKDE